MPFGRVLVRKKPLWKIRRQNSAIVPVVSPLWSTLVVLTVVTPLEGTLRMCLSASMALASYG